MNLQVPKFATRTLFIAICLSAVAFSDSGQHENAISEECPADQIPIAEIVNSLSCRLTTAIGDAENLFFSPFCLSVALAMAYLGTRGSTAKEMEEVLGYNLLSQNQTSATTIHQVIHDKLFALENHTEEYSLLVANALFTQSGYEILPNYAEDLRRQYGGKIKTLNFASDGEGAVMEINGWVNNYTQGKIETLLDEPLDPLTRLVLMNAIYFKGFWDHPFDERLTSENRFYKLDGSYKRVPFMEFKRKVSYFEDNKTNFTFLELDYKGDHISMLIMLPNGRTDPPVLDVTNALICRVRANFETTKVLARIPKFKMEYRRELSSDMERLGIQKLFTEGEADLSGMRSENDLFASMLVHKAVIEVNEKGTEAAAVSGLAFNARSGYIKMPVFKANHPFLFCIIDKRSGTILFTGRLSDP